MTGPTLCVLHPPDHPFLTTPSALHLRSAGGRGRRRLTRSANLHTPSALTISVKTREPAFALRPGIGLAQKRKERRMTAAAPTVDHRRSRAADHADLLGLRRAAPRRFWSLRAAPGRSS